MANEWTSSGTSACFNGSAENIPLIQTDLLTPGMFYFVKITINNSTNGQISIRGFEGIHSYSGNSDFYFVSKATASDLIINPESFGGGIFDGCITAVEVNEIPLYVIKDKNDNIIFSLSDLTGVTADRNYIQYQVDWTELSEGCYSIEFSNSGLDYKSDCFRIALEHACSLLLHWKNDEDGMGFNYSGLTFDPSMRVEGKLLKWHYVTEDKQVFEFSNGEEKILYARNYKEQYLSIKELPEYMHDAFSVALNHDKFYIDGISFVWRETEITPAHRKSTDTPAVEVNLRRQGQNLLNSNCG